MRVYKSDCILSATPYPNIKLEKPMAMNIEASSLSEAMDIYLNKINGKMIEIKYSDCCFIFEVNGNNFFCVMNRNKYSKEFDDCIKEDNRKKKRPEFGDLVYTLRAGRTLRQMSKDTGISISYISGLERNQYVPTLEMICRLVKYSPSNEVSLTTFIDRMYKEV